METSVRSNRLTDGELLSIAEAVRWAPSIHNSQPWLLRRMSDGVGVLEDLARSLPVIDPHGRERTISCGAAVLNARLTLHSLGYRTAVELLPEPADGTLLASVRALGAPGLPPDDEEAVLQRMIPLRHTHRRIYRSHLIAEEDLLDLRRAVVVEGARLSVVDPALRRRLAHLLRRAVHAQAADPELRREAERWVRRAGETVRAVDGIPHSSLGTSPFPVDSVIHAAHVGAPDTADVEEEIARSTLLVISTREDSRRDWLLAGLGLQRMLLTATAKGLVVTFADQAVQDPEIRPELAEVLGIWGRPQILLRIGRPLVEAPRTPRRPLDDLFA